MDRKQHPHTLTFPPLDKASILQCMQDLQIPFSNEDILKPTPQRMIQTYESLTDLLMGVSL